MTLSGGSFSNFENRVIKEQALANSKGRESTQKPGIRSATTLVPIVGMIYFSIYALAMIIQTVVSTGSLASYQSFFLPFAIISILAAIGIWRNSRFGYIAGMIISAILIIIFFATRDGNDVFTVLSNSANTKEFVFYITNVPLFFSSFLCSALGLRDARRSSKGSLEKTILSPSAFSLSKVVALITVGVVFGGLTVGFLAGNTQSNLVGALKAQQGGTNQVTIVIGAASSANGQFYSPATLTIKVGRTVTWINQDIAAHTVTSTTGAFNSGNMKSGAVFSYTFTQPGNYSYYCTYHSWMKGSIMVSS
jgi:plastocyanin